MSDIKICFSTLSCPDWSWHELIEYGTAYGFGGVEIRLIQRETDLTAVGDLQPTQLSARRRELQDRGFKVVGLASSVRFDYSSARERQDQVEIGKRYIELAVELNAEFIRVFGDTLPDSADASARRTAVRNIADGLDLLGELAAIADKRIVIETHGDFASSPVMAEMLERVESPAVGVLWDTHHPWRFHGEPLDETWNRLGTRTWHTHWKDSIVRPRAESATSELDAAARQAHALMSGHVHADYVLFGGGEFPAEQCMSLLHAAKYDGWFSLEWEKMWHPELEDPHIALPLFPAKIRRLHEVVAAMSN
ncbi:MAG: sugar phosphate isomerase/epimerase [Planctomycetota bacterium]|nr:sugar phosphate isomerase/epimerase [Planctomycetota bacterium]